MLHEENKKVLEITKYYLDLFLIVIGKKQKKVHQRPRISKRENGLCGMRISN
jgi:hypothetical protein